MKNKLIGRSTEMKLLENALQSAKSEMIAVIGRRRVGKTFLVHTVYEEHITFEITGTQYGSKKSQLENFHFLLQRIAPQKQQYPLPKDWLAAFRQLIKVLESKKRTKGKKVLFFDELPWLATRRSGFLEALGFFWNMWGARNNIVLVICGSAASWMIKRVIHNKGSLHNRITRRILLKPFTLAETEQYFKYRKINLNRYQIIQIYMIMGGIPHYLEEIKSGKSAVQNIDDICFAKDGLLYNEFTRLYTSLFDKAESHIKIIRALGKKWKGLTRKEIVTSTKLPDGGGVTNILAELIHSGFVSSYYPFRKKKKDMLYRLSDEYSLFYLHFIERKRLQNKGMWKKLSQTPVYKSWSGFAFESICLKHLPNIKKALDIGGVYSETSSFIYRGDKYNPGIQIDMLIDRNDQIINVCEVKFHKGPFNVTKSYAAKLRDKITTFEDISQTRKQVHLTFISSFGIKHNEHSLGLVDNSLDMNALFVK